MQELEPGDPKQLGRYRVVARLGSGGMGRVYLGRSTSGRALAIKVVRAELAESPQFRLRFAREVDAARRVTGFFTAAVVDADPDGTPAWLATAYVDGTSLQEAVHTHGAWPQRSVLALGVGLTEALEAIHRAGLVHRDLKPSNILLAADGPRVIDFGISIAADLSTVTQEGTRIGTAGYMSPEQIKGLRAQPASDVFALGAVLAYAATGSAPFGTGTPVAVHYRTVHEEPDLTGLPPDLEVIRRCLAKDPRERPGVPEVMAELAAALGDTDSATAPPGDGVAATRILTELDWLPPAVSVALPTAVTEPVHPSPPAQSPAEEAAATRDAGADPARTPPGPPSPPPGRDTLGNTPTADAPPTGPDAVPVPNPVPDPVPDLAAAAAAALDGAVLSGPGSRLSPGGTAFLDQLQATRDAGGDVRELLLGAGARLRVRDVPGMLSRLRALGQTDEARTLLVAGGQRRPAADVASLVDTLRAARDVPYVSPDADAAAVIQFCAKRMTDDFVQVLGDLDGLGRGPLREEIVRAAARHRFPGTLDGLADRLRAAGRRHDAGEISRHRRR
ncbi:serine/threonine-protein kinase [Streptomyces sp. NPDC058734]|uniref:serine/threonine-protein kinase n=1 Tax=Streptomyces sp. NPDC058734 TaxID=3346615 RepID=UPI003696BEBB